MAFASTVPLSNWLISNVGTICVPNGPCLIPVAPGLLAPSGVLTIGVALVLRDLIHRHLGANWAVVAILVGGVLSFFFASPGLALASVAAFLLSEMFDLAVYVPLARRSLPIAVFASGVVGAIIDSVAFIWLAFGTLEHVGGQIVGKLWASILVAIILFTVARRRRSAGNGVGI